MALKLNGKDDRLTRQDFLALSRTFGLTLGELAERLAERAKTLRRPAFEDQSERQGAHNSRSGRSRRSPCGCGEGGETNRASLSY